MSERESSDPSANIPEWPPEALVITPEMAAMAALPKAELVPAEGFAKYLCLRTCAQNRYVKGQIYTLPEGQEPSRFRRIDHES